MDNPVVGTPMNNETRVGIFVFIVIVIFIILSVKIGELGFHKNKTYPITMVFSTVEGLRPGAPLEVAGVKVGSVKGIALNRDYSAVVTADIYRQVQLPIDTIASIATRGIIGDKIIILTPGISKDMLGVGGNLARTEVPPSIDFLLTKLGDISENLSELTSTLNNALGGGGGMSRLATLMDRLNNIAGELSSLLSENEGNLSSIAVNLKGVTANVNEITTDLRGVGQRINSIVENIELGKGTLGRLVTDDTLYLSLRDTAENLNKISARLEQSKNLNLLLSDDTLYYNLVSITENLKLISQDIAEGKGTLGRLLVDDELYRELGDTLQNANEAAQGIKEQTPITVMGTVLGTVLK